MPIKHSYPDLSPANIMDALDDDCWHALTSEMRTRVFQVALDVVCRGRAHMLGAQLDVADDAPLSAYLLADTSDPAVRWLQTSPTSPLVQLALSIVFRVRANDGPPDDEDHEVFDISDPLLAQRACEMPSTLLRTREVVARTRAVALLYASMRFADPAEICRQNFLLNLAGAFHMYALMVPVMIFDEMEPATRAVYDRLNDEGTPDFDEEAAVTRAQRSLEEGGMDTVSAVRHIRRALLQAGVRLQQEEHFAHDRYAALFARLVVEHGSAAGVIDTVLALENGKLPQF